MKNLFGIHAAALEMRAKRTEVLAANIANAETPNYKALDVNFSDMLKAREAKINKTDKRHLDVGQAIFNHVDKVYRVQRQPSLDGNTVDLHKERAAFIKNTVMYQASLRFINGRINGLMTAIRGEL